MLNGDHIPSHPAVDKNNKPAKPCALAARDALDTCMNCVGVLYCVQGAVTSTHPEDRNRALVAEKQRLIASLKRCRTDEKADEILDKSVKIDKALIKATPTTLAGAAAGLTIAKYEFETFFGRGDDGYDVVLSMIDGAIRVLERETST